MARVPGLIPFSTNLEVKIKGMLDARMFVPSYADLLLFTADNYLFNGFIVAVYDIDPAKRGIYQLLDENNLNLDASWVNISSSTNIPDNLQAILDDFEARLVSLETDVAQAQIDILNAAALAQQALTEIANTNANITIVEGRVTVVEAILPNKADLVGGKVPLSQMSLFGVTRQYADIAARDADTDLTGVTLGLVLDPSGDLDNPGLTEPALYVNTDTGWVLYDATPSVQVILDWANITNKPISTVAQIDQAVADTLNQADITADITVGAWDAGSQLPALSTWEEAIRKLVEKTFNPTLNNPSSSLISTAPALVEIAQLLDFTLIVNFNRGNILGNVVGGVWNAGAFQNPRSGLANSFTIGGVTGGTNSRAITGYTVLQGTNVFTGNLSYLIGPQPLNSKGAAFNTPLPSGSTGVTNTSFEGVYPIFANTVTISSATKQGLISMLTGNNIELTLAAEANGNKQFFDIPQTWLTSRQLVAVYLFNTISNQYDTTNQKNSFNVTSLSYTIQGQTVAYTRHINSGSDRGQLKIKLIFN